MNRPPGIPDYATNVRPLAGGLWLWEFSSGAALYLGYTDGHGDIAGALPLDHVALDALIDDLGFHRARLKAAIQTERERQAAYDAYLEGA